MYKALFLDFPGNKPKAFTLSYDDGFIDDIRLADIMRKYNIKGTFNLNSHHILFGNEKRMHEEECKKLYSDPLFEPAVHGADHSFLESVSTGAAAMEILEDRRQLERIFEKPIFGMAYPYGTVDDELIEALKVCNIKYSRTPKSTEEFSLPSNNLLFNPTCHHNNPRLMELTEEFINLRPVKNGALFHVFGHSFEFDRNNNWDMMEKFLEKISGKDDIWYCTNIEFIEYLEAFKKLEMDVEMNYLYNPTAYDIYFRMGYPVDKQKGYVVKSGELLRLKRD